MDIMEIYATIKPFLPLAAALVLWLLKKFGPEWINNAPAKYKVAMAGIIGAVISFLTDYSSGITLTSVLMGVIGGLASSKGRDVLVGKPSTRPEPPKPMAIAGVD